MISTFTPLFAAFFSAFLQLVAQGEVGTDDFDAILCVVDGVRRRNSG